MRLTFFFLLLGFMQVAASSYSQTTRLNIDMRDATVREVLQAIENQSKFRFAYSSEFIDLDRKINISIQDQEIEEILKTVFSGTSVKYEIEDRHIMLLVPGKQPANQQQKPVRGTVSDFSGAPLPGVSVVVKGTTNGMITDADGNYSLINVPENATLQFSFVGMKGQEILVTGKDNINVVLEEDAIGIEEVVAIGYGTQKKVNLTGSVSSIGAQRLERRPIISTSATLQGIAPGVTVTSQSGSPGGDGGQIRIRGINSFGGSDCSPLILVDGIAYGSLDMVDANLIESISVLKDAASAAIYGSRAANGVILVTTKRASKDKFSVNYRGYIGTQQPTDIPKVTDGETFMNVFNVANMNDNGYNLYSDAEITEFRENFAADPSNYDWQEAILSGSGFTHNHFISLMANSDKIHVMPSFSYSSQDGIIKNTGFERFVFRNNMDIKPSDKLSIKVDLSFSNSDRLQIATEGDVWNYLGRMPTNIPIRRNGLWSEGWVKINPIGLIEDGGNRKTNNLEFLGNLSVDLKPAKWLTLTGVIAPRYRTRNVHTFSKSVMTYNDDGSEAGAAYTYTDLTETAYRYFFGNYQFFANAVKEYKDHSFGMMVGTSRETYDEKYLMGYRRDYTYDTYEVLAAGADNETKDNNGTHAQWILVSGFGRFNYDYKDRYLFEANLRYDGSSRFSSDNRWATFPSFSAGWRISEEPFMEKTKSYIDHLKLRASWGKLGNQNIGSSYYPYISQLSVGSVSMGKQIYQLVALNDMANPDLRWEETQMTGVGIDLNLFNHFTFTGDWYRKDTDGILLTLYTSQLTGLNAPYQNAAKVRNTGWDFGATYDNQWGDFKLGVELNFSDVKNEITDMRGQTSGTLLRQQEGYAVNSIYGYISEGLYQSPEEINAGPVQFGTLHPGDIKYKDIAGAFDENNNPIADGKITDEDKTIIGNTIPRYTYGMNLNLAWKGIKLNAFFQGVGKVDGYLNSHYVVPCANSSAIKTWQLDYWTEENTDAAFPRPSITSTNNTQNSDYWMKSAAYMRLKNLQLGYDLPKNLLKNLRISNMYVYVNAQNLFTSTNFWKGYDPEINYNAGAEDGVSLGSGAYYPQVKVFSFGVDLKF
ncbi:MAG TPA: SusC/RagA family protein [Prolixibacteraceae bacterium]|nr:SusC/RagA family protein [Prolixibacteraceae bacterium]HCR92156.1 SusC/RagA family protein [Prolixibacteraceae bacterium]HCU60309.1 SusC/RagA family protein [Prolixibacteraceae bacterium]